MTFWLRDIHSIAVPQPLLYHIFLAFRLWAEWFGCNYRNASNIFLSAEISSVIFLLSVSPPPGPPLTHPLFFVCLLVLYVCECKRERERESERVIVLRVWEWVCMRVLELVCECGCECVHVRTCMYESEWVFGELLCVCVSLWVCVCVHVCLCVRVWAWERDSNVCVPSSLAPHPLSISNYYSVKSCCTT